jgi:hypothetical protein
MVGRLWARLRARLWTTPSGKSPPISNTYMERPTAQVAPSEEISSFVTQKKHVRGRRNWRRAREVA